ncbi:hypothetical protein [Natronosalvus halobius]|uniref:hypothetical protein n=1 Tax=Natronosalvus halobius TaxID=2953746 RepID=UPI0020A1D8FE|nr:hypothetical protein [Natronosalvus halobius]USZ72222.1 hypothetical protein NGM15_02610 [Natronosalvus halobius]
MHVQRLKRLLEFFVIGVAFGVTEDVLAVVVATDAAVTPQVIGIVVLIAVPFAVLSELIVDHPRFLHFDRLAVRFSRAAAQEAETKPRLAPRIHWDGRRDRLMSPKHHHHRCNLCGDDFDTGEQLREHVERRHPKRDVHWWVVAEDPAKELRFSRE